MSTKTRFDCKKNDFPQLNQRCDCWPFKKKSIQRRYTVVFNLRRMFWSSRQHFKKFTSRVELEVCLLLIPYSISSSRKYTVVMKMQSNDHLCCKFLDNVKLQQHSSESYLGISIAEFDCNISFQLIFEPHSLHTCTHTWQPKMLWAA